MPQRKPVARRSAPQGPKDTEAEIERKQAALLRLAAEMTKDVGLDVSWEAADLTVWRGGRREELALGVVTDPGGIIVYRNWDEPGVWRAVDHVVYGGDEGEDFPDIDDGRETYRSDPEAIAAALGHVVEQQALEYTMRTDADSVDAPPPPPEPGDIENWDDPEGDWSAGAGERRPSKKAIDSEIERIYYRHGQGVQIDIMDIGKIFAAGHAALAASQPMEPAIVEAIARYRRN